MKKRKFKRKVIFKIVIVFILIVVMVVGFNVVKTLKYHKTLDYKLKTIGYSDFEIASLSGLSDENIQYVLENSYNEVFVNIVLEKYFIDDNFLKYIDYYNQNPSEELSLIVGIINVKMDDCKTNLDDGFLMLVNKFCELSSDYLPTNVKEISSRYAYSDNFILDDVLDFYKEMFKAAETDGAKLVISSGYRSYQDQEETYNQYLKARGRDYVNSYVALPGHSEHQTGFAFDILTLGANTSNFEETKEFSWLKNNAYKYGFIMRYPKGKEKITGYQYEPWHYRYVGKEVALKIHEEDITFDEYYAYYIEK